jgi:Tat protein translocase TatB subunit
MFGMSMTELLIIGLFALIVLGPKELPAAARTVGKALRDLRRTGDDLRDTFEREIMQENPLPQLRPVLESVAQEVAGLPKVASEAASIEPAGPVHAAPVLAADAPMSNEPEAVK